MMGAGLEKSEWEVEVKVEEADWLAMEEVVVDISAEQGESAGERATNMSSSSEGILQMGRWEARMNSSLSFSFSRLAMSFCRLALSSSRSSVSYQGGREPDLILLSLGQHCCALCHALLCER